MGKGGVPRPGPATPGAPKRGGEETLVFEGESRSRSTAQLLPHTPSKSSPPRENGVARTPVPPRPTIPPKPNVHANVGEIEWTSPEGRTEKGEQRFNAQGMRAGDRGDRMGGASPMAVDAEQRSPKMPRMQIQRNRPQYPGEGHIPPHPSFHSIDPERSSPPPRNNLHGAGLPPTPPTTRPLSAGAERGRRAAPGTTLRIRSVSPASRERPSRHGPGVQTIGVLEFTEGIAGSIQLPGPTAVKPVARASSPQPGDHAPIKAKEKEVIDLHLFADLEAKLAALEAEHGKLVHKAEDNHELALARQEAIGAHLMRRWVHGFKHVVFSIWITEKRRRVRNRIILGNCLIRLRHQLESRAFGTWLRNTKQAALVAQAMRRWVHGTKYITFSFLLAEKRRRMRNRVIISNCLGRMKHQLEYRAFRTWVTNAKHQAANRHKVIAKQATISTHLVRRWIHGVKLEAFSFWLTEKRRRARNRMIVNRCLNRIQYRQGYRAFNTWAMNSVAYAMRRERELRKKYEIELGAGMLAIERAERSDERAERLYVVGAYVARRFQWGLKHRALAFWVHEKRRLVRARRVVANCTARMRLGELHRAFNTWVTNSMADSMRRERSLREKDLLTLETVQESNNFLTETSLTLAKLQKRSLLRATQSFRLKEKHFSFTRLKQHAKGRVHARELMSKVIRRTMWIKMNRTFSRWHITARLGAELRHSARTLANTYVNGMNVVLVQSVFEAWRMHNHNVRASAENAAAKQDAERVVEKLESELDALRAQYTSLAAKMANAQAVLDKHGIHSAWGSDQRAEEAEAKLRGVQLKQSAASLARWMRRQQWAAWNLLREEHVERLRRRGLVAKARGRLQHFRLAILFDKWASVVRSDILARQENEAREAMGGAEERLEAKLKRVMDRECKAALARLMRRQKWSAWLLLRDHSATRRRRRGLLSKTIGRLQNMVASKAFGKWARVSEVAKLQRLEQERNMANMSKEQLATRLKVVLSQVDGLNDAVSAANRERDESRGSMNELHRRLEKDRTRLEALRNKLHDVHSSSPLRGSTSPVLSRSRDTSPQSVMRDRGGPQKQQQHTFGRAATPPRAP